MSSKSKDKLPPLPRTPHTAQSQHHQQQQLLSTTPIEINQSSNNNTTNLPIEFDRSLNIRRSKRFVRQSAQTSQTIQQHVNGAGAILTTQEIPLSTSPSSQMTTITNSLQKAISTPSILDKLKSSTAMTSLADNSEDMDDKICSQQTALSNVSSSISLNTAAAAAVNNSNDNKKNGIKFFSNLTPLLIKTTTINLTIR